MIPQRHHLVFLKNNAHFSIQSLHYDIDTIHNHVVFWLQKNLPCIYARQITSSADIYLGLCLLVKNQKQRISIKINPSAIDKLQPLPKLIELQSFLSRYYNIRLLSKLAIVREVRGETGRRAAVYTPVHEDLSIASKKSIESLNQCFENVHVYGSFLFHYLSGQNFVTKSSDLDILIEYSSKYSLASLKKLIGFLQKKFARPIDGEMRFNKLGDISIKELIDLSSKSLLCKTSDNVVLLSRAELYASYPML